MSKGGGFTHYLLVCDQCGDIKSAPHRAPREINHTMTESESSAYLADKSRWTKDGPKFEPVEEEIIQQLLGSCVCGGSMIPEWNEGAIRRCPNSRGTEISATPSDILTG
jgi:hypothetical protein